MPAKTLMIQGTSSSVGKSLLVAGLCRLFARRGVRVAPFKAQNMSNNAAVCADGAEIGRAQAVQARAAGIEPTAQMNPILLKPEGQTRSQVVVMGQARRTLSAREFFERKNELWPIVTTALESLRGQFDLVLIEGAGSPVELNLARGDIVNMAVARHANSPVLLAGDIDRGGVFAQLLGTLWLLPPEERRLVKGLIVNRFRGDRSLFEDGVRILETRGEAPVLGVVPYLDGLEIPEEDAVALESGTGANRAADIDIAVIRLPHIANFDDFDPLQGEQGIHVRYVTRVSELGRPDAIILPGTKTTIADLAWLRAQGFDRALAAHLAEQGHVVGICGGYQMLGEAISDPDGVETPSDGVPGLGLLPIHTIFCREKATHQVEARVIEGPSWMGKLIGATLSGYEIHMGRTESAEPWLALHRRDEPGPGLCDGAVDEAGRVWGCYVHGLFANDAFRRAWLDSLPGNRRAGGVSPLISSLRKSDESIRGLTLPARQTFDTSLNRLADALEQALNMKLLDTILAES